MKDFRIPLGIILLSITIMALVPALIRVEWIIPSNGIKPGANYLYFLGEKIALCSWVYYPGKGERFQCSFIPAQQ